jgi:hypothetical protein
MRFKKIKKEKVIPSFSSCVPKGYIRDRDFANPLFKIKRWPIASKIEEATRLSELSQFLCVELGLEFPEDQSPDMIHIDPGPKDDKDIRLIQFRHRFGDLKCGNSHFFSLHPLTSVASVGTTAVPARTDLPFEGRRGCGG